MNIAKKLHYQPVKELDQNRPYVLLIEKNKQKFVIKTDHFEDEAEILKILNSDDYFAENDIIVPGLYEFGKKYLIQSFIKGEEIDIQSQDFAQNLQVILDKLNLVHTGLTRRKEIFGLAKGWDDQYSKTPFQNSFWFKKRINRWFSDEQSKPKYRFNASQITKVIDLFSQIKGRTVINFGAFSPAHIRIQNNKIGLFDFGRHIRWAPKHYDRAYLWWGLLFEKENRQDSPDFWFLLAKNFAQDIPTSELAQYWACVLERLAGLSKDLTVSSRARIPAWHKMILKVKNRLIPLAIEQLEKSLL